MLTGSVQLSLMTDLRICCCFYKECIKYQISYIFPAFHYPLSLEHINKVIYNQTVRVFCVHSFSTDTVYIRLTSWIINTRIIHDVWRLLILSNEEKRKIMNFFKKEWFIWKCWKRGGVVEKRGEEETKSMPHAPVISTTDDTTIYGIQYFKIQNNIGILFL